eukprot:6180848-Pleurochrysis_carterae.AAC.5
MRDAPTSSARGARLVGERGKALRRERREEVADGLVVEARLRRARAIATQQIKRWNRKFARQGRSEVAVE